MVPITSQPLRGLLYSKCLTFQSGELVQTFDSAGAAVARLRRWHISRCLEYAWRGKRILGPHTDLPLLDRRCFRIRNVPKGVMAMLLRFFESKTCADWVLKCASARQKPPPGLFCFERSRAVLTRSSGPSETDDMFVNNE